MHLLVSSRVGHLAGPLEQLMVGLSAWSEVDLSAARLVASLDETTVEMLDKLLVARKVGELDKQLVAW